MQKYRFLILVGFVPLFVLTILSLVGLFNVSVTDAPGNIPRATSSESLIEESLKYADPDTRIIGRIVDGSASPYESASLSADGEASDRVNSTLSTWNNFVASLDLVRQVGGSLKDQIVEPPAEIEVPQRVESLRELMQWSEDLGIEIGKLDDWLRSEEEKLSTLKDSQTAIRSMDGGIQGSNALSAIVDDRVNAFEAEIGRVKDQKQMLGRAKEGFDKVVKNYEEANESFSRGDYPTTISLLVELPGPLPPEVGKLKLRATFWRDIQRILNNAEQVSQQPLPSKEWPEWQAEIKRLIDQAATMDDDLKAEFAQQVQQLQNMGDMIDGKTRINNIEGVALDSWVRDAKQIVHDFHSPEVSEPVSAEIKVAIQRALEERLTKEAGRLTEHTSSYKDREQAVHMNDTVIIGVFKKHDSGAYYLYWKSAAAREEGPDDAETLHVGVLKERPRTPTPVQCADDFNKELSALKKNPLSMDTWERLHETCSSAIKRLDSFAKRGGPPDPNLDFEKDIQISGKIVELRGDITELLAGRSTLAATFARPRIQ